MKKLRSIFGPSKSEIWEKMAKEFGGKFKNGGLLLDSEITFRHRQWTIELDTYLEGHNTGTTTFTRMRAPFMNKVGLYFKIVRENIISSIGKFFGMQDIIIGDSYFD